MCDRPLMVSCRLVEAAAAVAATLTGLLLSNWWIILLLIWPPKAGNARLFLTVYKLSLCYYTLWREKKNKRKIYSCSSLKNSYGLNAIYTSCRSLVNLWSLFFSISANATLRLWTVKATGVEKEKKKMDSVTQSIHSKMPMCNWLRISCPAVPLPIWSILSLS